MAEPLLNYDELLAPIPGDDPAGESVSFTTRAEMDEARKEVDPEDFDESDPLRPSEAKWADWAGIIRTTKKTLTSASKDLLTSARLTEALTKTHGFAGLADGLVLMRRLMDECWDRLHPGIEDGDLEVRAGPFNWLGDDGRGARFPYSLRTVPLFEGEGRWYGLRDIRLSQEGKGKVKPAEIEKAINNTSREQCQALVDDVTRALTELNALLGVLNQRLGSAAPGMNEVRKVLDEVLVLARQALQRKGGPIEAASEEEQQQQTGDEAGGGGGGTGTVSAKAVVTRDDIYQRLIELADQLQKMEPHSPVPYLIRRGVELGSMPFPMLMKALIREDYAQAITEMNRELGIKEEPPPE